MKEWSSIAPWIIERFEQRGGANSEKALELLERFFKLTTVTDKPLAMINSDVDLLWHTAIEFTEFYSEYCNYTFGEIIHHRSHTTSLPIGTTAIRNFAEIYSHFYGSVASFIYGDDDSILVSYALGHRNYLPTRLAWSGWPGRTGSGLHFV